MSKLHPKLPSLECATLGAAMLLAVFAGCTAQRPVDAPEVAATSAEPAKPQAAVEVPEDIATRAEQESTPAADPPQTVEESSAQQSSPESVASDITSGREYRTVFYRADAKPAAIPTVQLSKGHEALCRVKVGDTMPAIDLERLGGGRVSLSDLAGKTATVVVFWKSDRRMSHQLLADLEPDVIEPFGRTGVAVVGIAVRESAEKVEAALASAGAKFPNLLDPEGQAFAQVGGEKLPRTYLLDPKGKILWFDIEYSNATRRELHQALRALLTNNQ